MSKVSEDLARVLEKAMAHANAENTRLHRPEPYRRESRKQMENLWQPIAALEPGAIGAPSYRSTPGLPASD